MKSFRPQLAFALLTVLACAHLTIGQDQPAEPPLGYNFKTINFPSASGTFAYAINDQGEVVGYYTGGGCSQASCGFTDVKGTFATLECALENATDIFDISNKGEIVGAYGFFGEVHGFILEANSTCFDVIDPNPNGGSLTEAWGVNDGGAVVASTRTPPVIFKDFATRQRASTRQFRVPAVPRPGRSE